MNELITDELLSQIPGLSKYTCDELRITRLEGLTNHNFRIQVGSQDWVLRLPRSETNGLIDRVAESNNQALAASIGIAFLPLWSDLKGRSLTRTLKHSRALGRRDFVVSNGVEKVAAVLRKLHFSGFQFRGLIEAGPVLENYFSRLPAAKQAALMPRKREAEEMLQRLVPSDLPPVASHIDPVLQNLLLKQQQLWLIDWEFSAMASPYWDLAIVCNAAGLNSVQARELLNLYCVADPQMEESMLSDYRFLLQLIDDCWMALVSA